MENRFARACPVWGWSGSTTAGASGASDIQNQSHYDATSNGISAGVGVGNTGKATGPGSVSGTPGVSPMISQNDSGDQSSTTRSAVSAGTINIANQGAQTQDVANLSRDTTNTNGTVANTPNVNNLLNQQADTMQAAQAAGQVVAQGIGDYAQAKQQGAQAQADAAAKAGDATLAAQYQAVADSCAEGGDNRAMLHTAGGALIGGLGGGSAFTAIGGAAGAGLTSHMAGELDDISKDVASTTGSPLIGNLAANVAAGVGGALVGGTAGAATASNVELYNQQAHKNALSTVCSGSSPCDPSLAMAAVNAAGANAQASPINAIGPDYATVGASSLSGSVAGAANLADGTVYLGYGVSQSFKPTSWAPGFTTTLGWVFGGGGASGTNNLLNGDGNQFMVSVPTPLPLNVVAAVTHAYGGPARHFHARPNFCICGSLESRDSGYKAIKGEFYACSRSD